MNRFIFVFMCACSTLFFTMPASAQNSDAMRVSVEDAVMRSLENNEAFLLQKLQPIRNGAFEKLARGEYDPALVVEAAHGRSKTAEVSRSAGEQFDVEIRESEIKAGLEQNTPLGTSLQATVSTERVDSSRTRVQYGTRLGVGVTQQLLKGLGPKVNLARLHKAELDTRISRHELAGYAVSLVAQTEVAYWEYVSAVEAVLVVENALDVAQVKLNDIQERISVGDVPENDAAAAAAEVGMRELTLLEAKKLEMSKKLALLQLMSPNIQTPLSMSVVPTSEVTASAAALDVLGDSVEEHLELAMASRRELAESKLRQEKRMLDVVVTRNGVLPKLELFIDLGKTGYAASFAESYENVMEPTWDMTAGVRFRHVLGNREARAERAIAAVDLATEKQAILNLKKTISYDVYGAWHTLMNAKKQLDVTRQTHAHREIARQSIQAKHEVGAATQLEVVQAERDLLQSELEEVTAKVQLQIALVHLYEVDGSLLKRRGIEIE